MKYWFVNLGKYYKAQRKGHYLWAPLYNKKGSKQAHWELMSEINKGDVILCNKNGRILSVGTAQGSAYLSNIPDELEQSWRSEGRKVDLEFIDIESSFYFKEHKDYILSNINKDENPFDINGNAKQLYLSRLDENIAKYLLKEINNKELNKLINLSIEYLDNEIEEIKEEQEQFEKINNGSIKAYTEEELSKLEKNTYKYDFNSTSNKKIVFREKTDPKLKATRMKKARYLCEIDMNHKTFTNFSESHQYMECHHIIPMSAQKDYPDKKLDSLFNLIALCPVCHSQAHYASLKEKSEIFLKMYELRKKEMMENGFDLSELNNIFQNYYKK